MAPLCAKRRTAMSDPVLHDGRFVWPPAGEPPTSPQAADQSSSDSLYSRTSEPSPPSPDSHGSIGARLARWWRDVEDAWLDPTALPLNIRAEHAGWTHDPFDAYCDRCGHTIGPHEASEFGCSSCASTRPPWDRFVRLGEYQPPLADWICEVKFERFRTLGLELGRALGMQIRAACGGIELNRREAVVVPVPTTLRRRIERGIDHAGVIAHAVASELGLPMIRALARDHRPSQRAVVASSRQQNVSGSMRLAQWHTRARLYGFQKGPKPSSWRLIILIDDVLTSGSTLRAAARALKEPGTGRKSQQTIIAAVLGVTPDPDRRQVLHVRENAPLPEAKAEFP